MGVFQSCDVDRTLLLVACPCIGDPAGCLIVIQLRSPGKNQRARGGDAREVVLAIGGVTSRFIRQAEVPQARYEHMRRDIHTYTGLTHNA